MPEMKSGGIEWVEDIPVHWEIKPLYCLFGERKSKNSLGEEQNLLSLSYGRIIRKDINTNGGLLPASFNTYNIIEPGDIIIRPTDLQNDKRSLRTGYSTEHGIITSAYIALKPISDVNCKYMHYLLHAYDVMKVFYNMGNGVRQGLNFDEFKRLNVCIPPISEQDTIVNFLDEKCEMIDSLTADIQSQIETLEEYRQSIISHAILFGIEERMESRDSGIFYIGNINKDWKISRIGYICNKLSRPFNPEDLPLICSNKGKVVPRDDNMVGKMVSEDNAMQGIHSNDIAIHGMDTWHGAIALSNSDGKITRVVHVCDSTEDKRFVVYYLQHLAFRGVYKLISNGIRGNTSDFRSWDKVKDIYIPLPNSKEESKICDYLDNICNEIDIIIDTKKEQLSTLAEYKKSLIYEYVTGKKEVAAA